MTRLPIFSSHRRSVPDVAPRRSGRGRSRRARLLAPGALVLLLAALAWPVASQQPTFSTKVEAVRVDVLVTERGKPVRGLGPGDFEVLDNGVRQPVDLVSFEQVPLNVILALDTSDSVVGDRLAHLRDAGRAVLDALEKDDQSALVTFSEVIVLGSGLTTDVARVREALDRTPPSGETSLVDAAFAGILLGESDVGRALLIVFSDGLDTSSFLAAERVLETAKRSDVVAYVVSAGAPQKSEFLEDLTSLTGGRLFQVESTKNLDRIFLGVLEEFRQRYLVSYSPTGVSKDGWHDLEVRVKNRKATVKARRGYLAGGS